MRESGRVDVGDGTVTLDPGMAGTVQMTVTADDGEEATLTLTRQEMNLLGYYLTCYATNGRGRRRRGDAERGATSAS